MNHDTDQEKTRKAHSSKSTSSPMVEVTKDFNASIESVWQAWSDPKLIQEWWGPETYTSPSIKVDFREEGKYLFSKEAPDGKVTWSTGTYLEIFPNELITCTDQFADESGNVITPEAAGMCAKWWGKDNIIFSVKFVKIDDTHTKLYLVHEGIPASIHDDCVSGWSTSLDKMKRLVESH